MFRVLAARIWAAISAYISPQLKFGRRSLPNEALREFLESMSQDFRAQLDAD